MAAPPGDPPGDREANGRGLIFFPDRCIYMFLPRPKARGFMQRSCDVNPVGRSGAGGWKHAPRSDFDAAGQPPAGGAGPSDAPSARRPHGGADAAPGRGRRRRGGFRRPAGV